MSTGERLPELKQIVGALLFTAKQPLTATDIRKVIVKTGEVHGDLYEKFSQVSKEAIEDVLNGLLVEFKESPFGLYLTKVAGGYRMENDSRCGPWIRQMLDKDKNPPLSRPALETLAIVACRQPCTRAQISAVRGVSVDHMVRNLVELELIKAVGRSELPGRPWLFGVTDRFMEHFGLNQMDEIPGFEELKKFQEEAQEEESPGGEGELFPDHSVNDGETDSSPEN